MQIEKVRMIEYYMGIGLFFVGVYAIITGMIKKEAISLAYGAIIWCGVLFIYQFHVSRTLKVLEWEKEEKPNYFDKFKDWVRPR